MKKFLYSTIISISIVLLVSCGYGTKDNEYDNLATVPVNIGSEVLDCFNQVNAFRTGSEAWFWNSDNSTKTNLTGKLNKLTLDENLCKAAQTRANEIAVSFSHTRPNGTSCYTVLSECSIVYISCGENIAAGNKSGLAIFNKWKEDNEKYSGQGHRRYILGDFTKIGIAYAYDKNSTYKYYWAMILTKD